MPRWAILFFQAFSFGSMFAFLTESSFVYQHLYHVSPNQYAWIFALNIITMMSFNRVTAWRLKTGTHPAKHPQMGHYRPIYRQSADDGFGVVAVFAAFVGFGTIA